MAELPEHVEAFLSTRITSLSQLEALLFLRRTGGEQTVDSVYRELKTSRIALARQLDELHDAGIVERNGHGTDATFCYRDHDAWATAVADLVHLYPSWRTRIAHTIFGG